VRDGEALAQALEGEVRTLNHGTRVPFSLELLEADHLPFTYSRAGTPTITAGVERNGWGRPIAYHFYRNHPGDLMRFPSEADLRRVPAAGILHLKLVDRMVQARGVSVFASVLSRLEDIKDYEESERIAAKVAASMAAEAREQARIAARNCTSSSALTQPSPGRVVLDQAQRPCQQRFAGLRAVPGGGTGRMGKRHGIGSDPVQADALRRPDYL